MNRCRIFSVMVLLSPACCATSAYSEDPPPAGAAPSSSPWEGMRSPCPSSAQLSKWFRKIDSIRADISIGDRATPVDCSTDLFRSGGTGQAARHAAVTPYAWVAPELWHQPLYFDDVPLEQYGQTKHPALQPAISMSRFYLTFPTLPYKMVADPPFSCVTTLGKYRSGSCNPCVLQIPR